MTVAQLCVTLTQEELLGWAAFFELRGEDEQKSIDQARIKARTA